MKFNIGDKLRHRDGGLYRVVELNPYKRYRRAEHVGVRKWVDGDTRKERTGYDNNTAFTLIKKADQQKVFPFMEETV